MNAPGLRKINDRLYESLCGRYVVERAAWQPRGGTATWIVWANLGGVGIFRNLRTAAIGIDRDKTRRATEILAGGRR